MARAIPTIPRKSASQKRSQATVETLLDATARVLTGGIRSRQHQPDRRDGRRQRRLALPVLPQQGGARGGARRAPQPGNAPAAARCPEGSGVTRPCNGDARTGAGDGRRPSGRSRLASHFRRTGSAHGPARQDRSAPAAKPSGWSGAYLEERRNEISVRDLDSATSICVTTVEALTHRVRHPQARCAGRRPGPVHRRGHAAGRGLSDAGPAIALDRAAPEAHCCSTTPVVVEIVGTRKRLKDKQSSLQGVTP